MENKSVEKALKSIKAGKEGGRFLDFGSVYFEWMTPEDGTYIAEMSYNADTLALALCDIAELLSENIEQLNLELEQAKRKSERLQADIDNNNEVFYNIIEND